MSSKRKKHWPVHGWIGLALVGVFWPLNWTLEGLRTHWGFFPMWLGYCLTVDALVFLRKGGSLLNRNPRAYAGLFLISIPGWWLFELINLRTQNWFYVGREAFTNLEYAFMSSISFSTVMPAVFGTAELASTFGWIKRIGPGPEMPPTPRSLYRMAFAGMVMLTMLLLWPRYCFPFVWLSVLFLLEPFNAHRKYRSLFDFTKSGNWRPLWFLWVGCLICGFFWEMWNFLSYPKWKYDLPFVGFLHVFEMPLLGYLGYLPFALELFALYHFVIGVFHLHRLKNYVELG